ncbi:MAG: protein phosphatase 2C domain-containing protein [Chloroflexota bacterium]|nr:protein phosphatase 2C domain-containing protein [Dehalococcoidia bacterium]MDW8254419.1 protein phosphatase 2C domain-containing protein [Chloroflexota bacterium]
MTELTLPEVVAKTDPGRSRGHNEDYVGHRVERRENGTFLAVFVVCDGMGGHPAGEVAAAIGATTILEAAFRLDAAPPRDRLRHAVLAANAAILQEGGRDPAKRGMGATCVAALLAGERLVIAHAGDCRGYLVSPTAIRRLTADHSWVGEQVRAGLLTEWQAQASPYRSVVTRALGLDPLLEPEVREERLGREEVLLLCSDGLWDVVNDDEMQAVIAAAPSLSAAADRLIDLANERGGPDNISVLLARQGAASA